MLNAARNGKGFRPSVGRGAYGNKISCISRRSSKKSAATVPTTIVPANVRKKGDTGPELLSGPVDCVRRSIHLHTRKPPNKVNGIRPASMGTTISRDGEPPRASELCAKSQKLHRKGANRQSAGRGCGGLTARPQPTGRRRRRCNARNVRLRKGARQYGPNMTAETTKAIAAARPTQYTATYSVVPSGECIRSITRILCASSPDNSSRRKSYRSSEDISSPRETMVRGNPLARWAPRPSHQPRCAPPLLKA